MTRHCRAANDSSEPATTHTSRLLLLLLTLLLLLRLLVLTYYYNWCLDRDVAIVAVHGSRGTGISSNLHR